MKAVAYEAPVDFVDLYQHRQVSYVKDLFLVVFTIQTPNEERGFEVAATQEWADSVFAASRAPGVKPPTPPI